MDKFDLHFWVTFMYDISTPKLYAIHIMNTYALISLDRHITSDSRYVSFRPLDQPLCTFRLRRACILATAGSQPGHVAGN